MSVVALRIGERKCAACQTWKWAEDFSGRAAYCRPCRAEYMVERAAAIREGTWQPKPRGGRAPAAPPAPVTHLDMGSEAALAAAMAAYYGRFGFSAFMAATERLRGQLAKRNRAALTQEGWIA